MNRNGHGSIVDYWIKVLSEPATRDAEMVSLQTRRRQQVLNSLLTRPFYLPLQFTMLAAGTPAPYTQLTAQLGYDVVITGVRTDSWVDGVAGTFPPAGRQIIVQFTNNNESQTIVRTGGDPTLYLRTDDIAGSTVASGGGQAGVFQLPSPIYLQAGNRIQVDMLKPDTTGANVVSNIVFVGFRVLPKAAAEAVLTPRELTLIDQYIANRETPEMRFLKLGVEFDAATVGSQIKGLTTTKLQEPVILRGIRSTLSQSTIQLGIDGEAAWMPSQVPIWAVTAENDLSTDAYLWFEKGVYLPSQTIINIPLIINGGVDGSNVDTTNGEITFIYQTV